MPEMRYSIELYANNKRKRDENFPIWKSQKHTLHSARMHMKTIIIIRLENENEKNNNKENDTTTECYLFLKIASNNLCVSFPNFRLYFLYNVIKQYQASESSNANSLEVLIQCKLSWDLCQNWLQ